ncbi:MAG: HesB/IscA family protein [Fimbriimonas sp.]
MITLTESASTVLQEMISSQEKAAALRVWVQGGGCSGLSYGMALDDANPDADDKIFEQNGIKIYVDSLSMNYMDGASVDYVDDVLGGGFKIENPNATSSCGCGSSFKADGAEAVGGGCGSGGCGSCGSR